jgi:hypothetical protein
MLGNDLLPQNEVEIGFSALFILIGSIVIGTIIGEFSSILGEISKRARQQNEEMDMIQTVMTGLKITEEIQSRVFEYYDLKNERKFVKNASFYSFINDNLAKTIKLY